MFGKFLKLDVTGASHAPEMTFRLENFPAGVRIDADALRAFMERRAPGRDRYSTARRETDEVEFRSGLEAGVTTGAPIVGAIANRDMRPGDYGAERTVPRPGHADFGQWIEMGRIPTGGGKNSGRLTAPVCAAGGICKQWLASRGIDVGATLAEVGGVTGAMAMLAEIDRARKEGDSVGGRVHCCVKNVPAGLGGALFDGLESALSAALFAIPGVRGVVWGDSVDAASSSIPDVKGVMRRHSVDAASSSISDVKGVMRRHSVDATSSSRRRGSAFNDAFQISGGEVVTATNHAGGILGGRTTGMPIEFDVLMKPTPTIFKEQDSVDLATMKPAKLAMKGRHDPCIVRRAVPVVEAVAAFVLADALCASEAAHPRICLTLTGKTLEEDLEQYQSQRYFTDMVELRVDLLHAKSRARAGEFPEMLRTCGHVPRPIPVIFTYRRKSDGGAFEGSEKTRERFFKSLLSCGSERQETRGVLYFDFEDDFHVPALEKLAREKGVRIVRSHHDFSVTYKRCGRRDAESVRTREKTGLTSFLTKDGAGEIAKFAFMPRGLKDVARLFSHSPATSRSSLLTSRSSPFPSHFSSHTSHLPLLTSHFSPLTSHFSLLTSHLSIAMGAQGLASRVLAARLGAPWTYASVGGLEGLGHVTPQELVRDYRFRSVTREATLYGVTGWPLKKTRSPELHNAMFAASDTDALMIPFPAETAREAIAFMNAMGMKGLAVTIPHKQAVMPLLDRIDSAACRVGAVNTVVREGKKLVGYNTDVAGFSEAIVAFVLGATGMSPQRDAARTPRLRDAARESRLRGLRVAVLGAGGASKAVVFALKKLGAKVVVYGRHPPHRKCDPHFANCGLNVAQDFDLIVNATPVDPIPEYCFTGRELVYDLVYVPEVTPLIARARAAGCRCENGFSMLVAQAREQQRLFFASRTGMSRSPAGCPPEGKVK